MRNILKRFLEARMIYTGQDGVLKGQIHIVKQRPPFAGDANDVIEVIERKGLGHPDTICDQLSSELSIRYAELTRRECDGLILHHIFDKVILIGGDAQVDFGEVGRFTAPIRVIVAGRASMMYRGRELPVAELVDRVVRDFMRENFPIPDVERDLIIEQRISSAAGPGTLRESVGPIANKFLPENADDVRGYGSHYVANDTSFCVAYSPASPLEQATLEAEAFLNSAKTKAEYPWLGTDIKIMAVRIHDEVNITACIPQIARYVSGLEDYKTNLDRAGRLLAECYEKHFASERLKISVNTKDRYDEMNVYVTATGSSLAGDIGVTGRGNRTNGLITGNRPMGMEGASGKNPRYFSGIVYNMLAARISERIYDETRQANTVHIVSQNGAPLLSPWQIIVSCEYENQAALRDIVKAERECIPELTEAFLRRELALY